MGSRQIGGPDDRSQIMGIFNSVQQEQEGSFSPLPRQVQHVLHLGVGIGRRIRDHPLVFPRLGKPGQSCLVHKLDLDAPLLRLS